MNLGAVDFMQAPLMFAIVLLMAAAPAHVTDQLHSLLQNKLAQLAHHSDVDADRAAALQVNATQLMQRAAILQGRLGMQFLGVSMTMSKALQVGTLLSAMGLFIVRNYS